MPPPPTPLLIDTDNALGSPWGDVDDAFALAALLRGGVPITAIASVAGNTGEALAAGNNRRLGELAGYPGAYLRGVEAPPGPDRIDSAWPDLAPVFPRLRIAALGPLTNIAALLGASASGGPSIEEVVLVGSTLRSLGRFSPWWPHEFNLTHDLPATRQVFASNLPLTLVPLDVARRLRVGGRELAALAGPLGETLRLGSRRWRWRSRLIRGSDRFPVYDLVAAVYLIAPELLETAERRVRLHANGWVEYGAGARRVRAVIGFDPAAVWSFFVGLVNQEPVAAPTAG
jgi:inosine-uridine nucleoside N-ribohydrolase